MTIQSIRTALAAFAPKTGQLAIDKGFIAIVIHPNKPEYMVVHHKGAGTTVFPKGRRHSENQEKFISVCGREAMDPRFFIMLKQSTPVTEIVLAMDGYTQVTSRKKKVAEDKSADSVSRYDGIDFGVVQMTDRFTGLSHFFTSADMTEESNRANNLPQLKKSMVRHIESPKAAKWVKDRMEHCGADTFDYEHLGKGYTFTQALAIARDMNDLQGQINQDLVMFKLMKTEQA